MELSGAKVCGKLGGSGKLRTKVERRLSTANASFTLTADAGVPTTSATFPAAAGKYNATGWTDAITGTAADTGGSGLARVELSVREGTGNYYGGTAFDQGAETFLTATGTSSWSYALADAKLSSGNEYTIHVRAVDNVNNVESFQTIKFVYDTAAPTVGTINLTGVAGTSSAFKSGNTVWYRGTDGGDFELSIGGSDTGGAGFASATTTSVSQGTLTHTGSTVAGASPVTSNSFAWTDSSGANANATTDVTVADAAGNTSGATQLTLRDDSTPAATTMQCNAGACSGTYTSAVSITFGATDGAGAGVTRNEAGFGQIRYTTDGTEPSTASNLWTGAPISWTTPGTTTFKFKSWDDVGNVEASQSVDVTFSSDATPPTNVLSIINAAGGGAYLTGTGGAAVDLWYRGSVAGSFQLQNMLDDGAGSGDDKVDFPAATGGTWSGGATTDLDSPYRSATYSWTAGTSNFSGNVVGYDVAGNTATTAVTFRNDSAAPTVVTYTAPTAGSQVGGSSVTVSVDGADTGGSGATSAEFRVCAGTCDPFGPGTLIATDSVPAGDGDFSVTWDAAASGEGLKTLGVRLTDNVGNVSSTSTRQVTVDTTAPSQTIAPTSVSGGVFKSGDTVWYRGTAGGSLTLTSTVTDAGSGANQVVFNTLGGTTANWTFTTNTDTSQGQSLRAPSAGPMPHARWRSRGSLQNS
jgi:hypothetical protein